MITIDSRTLAHLADRLAPQIAERLATLPRPVDGDPEALLSEIAAAALLGLRPATLCSWRSRGVGPRFLRLGNKRRPAVRYRLGDVLKFRDARATDPGK